MLPLNFATQHREQRQSVLTIVSSKSASKKLPAAEALLDNETQLRAAHRVCAHNTQALVISMIHNRLPRTAGRLALLSGRKKISARGSAKVDLDDLSRSLGRHNHLRAETPVAETHRRDNDYLAQFAALIETLKVSHQQFESACVPELFLHLLTLISACTTSPVPPARTHARVRLLSGTLGSPAGCNAIRGIIGPTIRCMAATWEKGTLVMRYTHSCHIPRRGHHSRCLMEMSK